MISNLQYISQGISAKEQEYNIHKVLDNGAKWIQLRWKNATEVDVLTISERIKLLCDEYKATFIINDFHKLAHIVDADGVHLGLGDAKVIEARALLGNSKIIGGTANTRADVEQRMKEGCDYIGLGPYRYTQTKMNLSPILGLTGYNNLIQELVKTTVVPPPVIAIGGITLQDIPQLIKMGVYGVALSKELTDNPSIITQIQDLYHETITNS